MRGGGCPAIGDEALTSLPTAAHGNLLPTATHALCHGQQRNALCYRRQHAFDYRRHRTCLLLLKAMHVFCYRRQHIFAVDSNTPIFAANGIVDITRHQRQSDNNASTLLPPEPRLFRHRRQRSIYVVTYQVWRTHVTTYSNACSSLPAASHTSSYQPQRKYFAANGTAPISLPTASSPFFAVTVADKYDIIPGIPTYTPGSHDARDNNRFTIFIENPG